MHDYYHYYHYYHHYYHHYYILLLLRHFLYILFFILIGSASRVGYPTTGSNIIYLGPGSLHRLLGLPAIQVCAGVGVAKLVTQVGQHGIHDTGIDGRRGLHVQVERQAMQRDALLVDGGIIILVLRKGCCLCCRRCCR